MTESKVTLKGSDGFRVENINVTGLGAFQVDFKWNPTTLSFQPDTSSIVASGNLCQAAVMDGNLSYSSNNKSYSYRTRTTSNLEVGAITALSSDPSAFIVSWAKTKSQADNPYLVGRDLTSFDSSKGYGVVGYVSSGAYPGFSAGDIVEVTGSPNSGAVTVKLYGGTTTATFTLSSKAFSYTATKNCKSSAAGTYSGNVLYSSSNLNAYAVTIYDVQSGAIAANSSSGYTFSAAWDASKSGKSGFNYGRISTVSSGYTQFLNNDPVFIADVGSGFAFGSMDLNGKVKGTAVFLQ